MKVQLDSKSMCNRQDAILYIGFYSLPDLDAAANRVLSNAKLFSSLGFEVLFIDEQCESPFNSFIGSKHRIDEFQVYSQKRPRGIRATLKKMVSIKNVIDVLELHTNIKMIIAYNYPSIALERLRRYCRNKVKLCSDCTDWYSGKEYKFPINILSSIDSFYRMRIVQKRLDGIICISSYLYNYYYKTTNCVFLPPLVDKMDSIWNQRILEFDKEMINLIYGGNPGRKKDQLLPIIHSVLSVQRKNRFTLRIVGITKEDFIKVHPDMSENMAEFDNHVLFFGRVSHKDYIQLLMSSDYLVFLRDKNRVSDAGFSTKFVEAVSCGCAVITTNTGDLKTFINEVGQGYVLSKMDDLVSVLEIIDEPEKTGEKNKIAKAIFDYHNYLDMVELWVKKIIKTI